MRLMLDIAIKEPAHHIRYTDKIMMIGSCFTGEIGNRLRESKFIVLQNPNGILYDPLSISSCIHSCIENKKYEVGDLFYYNELWHSWQHHSSFSGIDNEKVVDNINNRNSKAHDFLKEANWLILTLGTSFNYKLISNNQSVANCHKIPAANFQKDFISIKESIHTLGNSISLARSFNPNLRMIFTVSPVKHTRDGIVENSHSKARLIEVVHSLKAEFEGVYYFPSYELVTDVLRDHRFYKEDLVHPNSMAINFVFKKFVNSFMASQDVGIMREVNALMEAKAHKPMYPSTVAFDSFRKAQLEKIKDMLFRYPFLDLSEEKIYFGN